MSARRLDGTAVAAAIRAEVVPEVRAFTERAARAPGLSIVLVGDDPASHVYVRNKEKAADKCGIRGVVHRLPADSSQQKVRELVMRLDDDPAVDGILVQLPLPSHLDALPILDRIDPGKDVDGLHPMNAGLLLAGRPGLRPCTPSGCMRLLAETGFDPKGARAVVIGRSALVGKPIALMLLEKHATVTMAHSRTRDLAAVCREADIVVAAVGKKHLVAGDWIKEGAIVLDVGINRGDDGKLYGDVDTAAASERASFITPVPGGVGPMTIAMLLANTVTAAEARARG